MTKKTPLIFNAKEPFYGTAIQSAMVQNIGNNFFYLATTDL
jgi:hypothetical protein